MDFQPDADMFYIALGSVDGEIDCPAGFHQFVASRNPWFDIHDELPQHDEWPDESVSFLSNRVYTGIAVFAGSVKIAQLYGSG